MSYQSVIPSKLNRFKAITVCTSWGLFTIMPLFCKPVQQANQPHGRYQIHRINRQPVLMLQQNCWVSQFNQLHTFAYQIYSDKGPKSPIYAGFKFTRGPIGLAWSTSKAFSPVMMLNFTLNDGAAMGAQWGPSMHGQAFMLRSHWKLSLFGRILGYLECNLVFPGLNPWNHRTAGRLPKLAIHLSPSPTPFFLRRQYAYDAGSASCQAKGSSRQKAMVVPSQQPDSPDSARYATAVAARMSLQTNTDDTYNAQAVPLSGEPAASTVNPNDAQLLEPFVDESKIQAIQEQNQLDLANLLLDLNEQNNQLQQNLIPSLVSRVQFLEELAFRTDRTPPVDETQPLKSQPVNLSLSVFPWNNIERRSPTASASIPRKNRTICVQDPINLMPCSTLAEQTQEIEQYPMALEQQERSFGYGSTIARYPDRTEQLTWSKHAYHPVENPHTSDEALRPTQASQPMDVLDQFKLALLELGQIDSIEEGADDTNRLELRQSSHWHPLLRDSVRTYQPAIADAQRVPSKWQLISNLPHNHCFTFCQARIAQPLPIPCDRIHQPITRHNRRVQPGRAFFVNRVYQLPSAQIPTVSCQRETDESAENRSSLTLWRRVLRYLGCV